MAQRESFDKKLDTIEEQKDTQAEIAAKLASGTRDDETRQEVAKKFVRYYFEILLLIIIGIPIYNLVVYRLSQSTELAIPFKDAILTYSAIVGPTLGLVVAYYFESKKD